MNKAISDLVTISRYYGEQKDYTLGGGGNTSYKDQNIIYVKASGYALGTINESGFAVLDRNKLRHMVHKSYSEDQHLREHQVKEDLMSARKDPLSPLRPSVETLLHDAISYTYVVHTHPHLVNGLLCSRNAETQTKKLFRKNSLYIPYTDPGIVLFRAVLKQLETYRSDYNADPNYLFLQNHGVFVAANSIEDIKSLYKEINDSLLSVVKVARISNMNISDQFYKKLSMLRDYLPAETHMETRYNTLIHHFTKNLPSLNLIERPFIPDQIVYCKAYPLIIRKDKDPLLRHDLELLFKKYYSVHSCNPKILLFENGPMVCLEENKSASTLVLDVFEDAMKISFYSRYFGGPNFMSDEQIDFIENWEVEHYRRKVSKSWTDPDKNGS